MADRVYGGGLFDNDEILWFILVFLVIFYCRPFFGLGPVGTC